MTDRTFRNHFTVVIDALSMFLFLGIFITYYLTSQMDLMRSLMLGSAFVIVTTVLYIRVWLKTTVSFTETEIITNKDLRLFKTKNRIPYSRLASIEVYRGVINKLLGTTRLMFNVNSSVGATVSNATLTLKSDLAEEVRNELNALIFAKENTVLSEKEIESIVDIRNFDIIRHAVLSQTTPQLIFAILMLAYSLISIFLGSASGFVSAFVLLVFNEVVPFVSLILKYYNYRLYRIGDTITVESGLISTRRQSFKINKVNSLRIRRPLLARVFGLSALEAEVIGLSTSDSNDTTPLLCPMKADREVRELVSSLMPEVVFDSEPIRQSKGALKVMALVDSIIVLIAVAILSTMIVFMDSFIGYVDGSWHPFIIATLVAAMVIVAFLTFGYCGLAQRHRTFAMGPDSFMLVYGAYDTKEEYILYDKVQFTQIVSGPLDRAFGVACCKVSLMSSIGYKEISSGLFEPEDLKQIPDEIMARIHDGRYDHRRYE